MTALAVGALHGTPLLQVSVLRLIALVTARYNWQRDEVSIGQGEMARIWGVHERTAKREVRRLQDAGLWVCIRPGVRGRVASYRLDRLGIERFSRPVWELLGESFAERAGRIMGSGPTQNVVRLDFGTHASNPNTTRATGHADDGPWAAVMARLSSDHPDTFAIWFHRLSFVELRDGILQVSAPNAFVRDYVATHLTGPLIAAASAELGLVRRLSLCLHPS
ncbi:MAG: hypothetical protein KDA73_18610 [Rhodobacteraceae bacterium]|nr:hypothetical protein [Paracoccaceae bacterium]